MAEHAHRISATSVFWPIGIAAASYRLLEDRRWVESLHSSVVPIATTGFGDLIPATDMPKPLTLFNVLLGVVLITTSLDIGLEHRAGSRHSNT